MISNELYQKFDANRLMAIHRQWIRANIIKGYFDAGLSGPPPKLDDKGEFEKYFIGEANTFMYVWYSLLFSIVEATCDGLRKDVDTALDREGAIKLLCGTIGLDEAMVHPWKKLRDTTFHIRSDYWDTDMFKVMFQPEAGKKIRAAHETLGQQMLDELKRRRAS